MKSTCLSKSEKRFILDGITQNFRVDGRERYDYRSFVVETGVLCQANGSSRVRLHQTEILVGVKLEVGVPSDDLPNCGKLIINLESSPSVDRSHLQEATSTLQEVVESALDLTFLCIREREACWFIYVDCLVLSSSGNIFDALGLGVKAALGNTLVPSVEVIDGEEGAEVVVSDDRNDLIHFKELFSSKTKKVEDEEDEEEIEEDGEEDDEEESEEDEEMIGGRGDIPVFITFGIFPNSFCVDPCLEEEGCMESAITLGILDGSVYSVHKRHSFGVHPTEIKRIMKIGRKIGTELQKKVDGIVVRIESKDENHSFFD